jgi:hypothetical protein
MGIIDRRYLMRAQALGAGARKQDHAILLASQRPLVCARRTVLLRLTLALSRE